MKPENKSVDPGVDADLQSNVATKGVEKPTGGAQEYVLRSPGGRIYRTSSAAEARQLHRTRGYKVVEG